MKHSTIEFSNGTLKLIDQRYLPVELKFFQAEDYREVVYAIAEMVVRGAPAIGAAAAYGVYLAAREYQKLEDGAFLEKVKEADRKLLAARPTAVNLSWAVRRMESLLLLNQSEKRDEQLKILLRGAEAILREDVEINRKMAGNGNEIVPEGAVILTHCNAGALATVDYGTALGVIREAHAAGKGIRVFADETRPRLQGARLTAFELHEEGIPTTLISDSVAPILIRDGKIDLILVGADRIAANGDTANKIGTYMLSEIARRFEVPFYIVAPTSTIDYETASGEEIVIEERPAEEVTHIRGVQIAPEGIEVYNPAFDVTPAENITAVITEKGIVRPPFTTGLEEIRGI